MQRAYQERGAAIKEEYEDSLGKRKGVDRLSHAWYNATLIDPSIEDKQ